MKLIQVIVPLLIAGVSLAQNPSQAAHDKAPGSDSLGAPEIDVALVGAALALVIGVMFVLNTMRRRKLVRA